MKLTTYFDAKNYRMDFILKWSNCCKYFLLQVCHAAVGLVGDICRALGPIVAPYCDEIMTILLENLSNNDVHRMVKPQVLSVFGDIALALGLDFKKYLEVVLQTLMQASHAQVDRVGCFAINI
jgi:importin subunit beta-1